MSCHKYQLDIELLPALDVGDGRFQQAISHLQQCPRCLARYEAARKLDAVLAAGLNALDPPASFPAKIMSYIQYSLLPLLRKTIFEEVKATDIHPPARWIHQQIQLRFPDTSLQSVCRHLTILKEAGNILECDFGEGFKRYDGNLNDHCHFICRQCDGIYDIFRPARQLVKLTEIQQLGYRVLEPKLELRGICKKCNIV